jgi:hypothetical protein
MPDQNCSRWQRGTGVQWRMPRTPNTNVNQADKKARMKARAEAAAAEAAAKALIKKPRKTAAATTTA